MELLEESTWTAGLSRTGNNTGEEVLGIYVNIYGNCYIIYNYIYVIIHAIYEIETVSYMTKYMIGPTHNYEPRRL